MHEVEANPPVIESFKYETKMLEYVLCVDTLGKDSELREEILSYVEGKANFFREKWENKEYNMLLADILLYIE